MINKHNTTAIMAGVICDIATTASDYFIQKRTFYEAANTGITTGIAEAFGTVTVEYIDIRTKTVNALYHSGIDTILSTGFIMLGKKFLKFKSPDPSKFSVSDMGLITISIAAADLTREYAVKKGWIPENLNM